MQYLEKKLADVKTEFEMTEEQQKELDEQKQKTERRRVAMNEKQLALVKKLNDLRRQIAAPEASKADLIATHGEVMHMVNSLSGNVGAMQDSLATLSEKSITTAFVAKHHEETSKTFRRTAMGVMEGMFIEEDKGFWDDDLDYDETKFEEKEHTVEEFKEKKREDKAPPTGEKIEEIAVPTTVRQQVAHTLPPMRPYTLQEEDQPPAPNLAEQGEGEDSSQCTAEDKQGFGGMFGMQQKAGAPPDPRQNSVPTSSEGQADMSEDLPKKKRKKKNNDKKGVIASFEELATTQSPATIPSRSHVEASSAQSGDSLPVKGEKMDNIPWPGSGESSAVGMVQDSVPSDIESGSGLPREQPDSPQGSSRPPSAEGRMSGPPSEMIRRMLNEPIFFDPIEGAGLDFDDDEPTMEFGLSLEEETGGRYMESQPPSLPPAEPASAEPLVDTVHSPVHSLAPAMGSRPQSRHSDSGAAREKEAVTEPSTKSVADTGAFDEAVMEMPKEPSPVYDLASSKEDKPRGSKQVKATDDSKKADLSEEVEKAPELEKRTEIANAIDVGKSEKKTEMASEAEETEDPREVEDPTKAIEEEEAREWGESEELQKLAEAGKGKDEEAEVKDIDPATVPLPKSTRRKRKHRDLTATIAAALDESPTRPIIPPVVDDVTWSELSVPSLIKGQVRPWWDLLHCFWILVIVNPICLNAAVALEFRAWLRWHLLGRRSHWHAPTPGRTRMTLRSVLVVLTHCFLMLTAQVWVATTREREIWERGNGVTRQYLISRIYEDPSLAMLPGVDPNLMFGRTALAAVLLGGMHFWEEVVGPKVGDFQVDFLTAMVPVFLFSSS